MQISRSHFSSSLLTASVIASFSCAVPALAQVDRSALVGTVIDPFGGLLGHAHITAMENSTQLRREGMSDAVGRYEIAAMPVGRYTITVDHPGFETLTFAGVQHVVGGTRTYDGVEETSVINQTQRAWARLDIPLDAIAHVRVDTLLANAEKGATGGAQLAVVSPSGTNQLHGRLFEYLRNNVFDAPEPFWASNDQSQQLLRLNQFGGSLGGPIVREKTFFFIASEAYRQVWGYPTSGDVPSAAFKASIPASSPLYAIVNAYPGAGPHTVLTPYTPANDPGDPYYANYDPLTCACTQVVNENSAILQVDQHFSANDTGFMRFSYDRAVNTQPVSAAATDLQQKVTAPVNGVLEYLHIFSPYLTNEARFGFNRSSSNTYNSSDTGSVYQIAISAGLGPGFVPQNYNYNAIYVGNTFSEIDDLTWLPGRLTFKTELEIREVQLNQNYGQHGTVTYATLETLAANKVRKASLTGALPINDLRKTLFIGSAQDEYKAKTQSHPEPRRALPGV